MGFCSLCSCVPVFISQDLVFYYSKWKKNTLLVEKKTSIFLHPFQLLALFFLNQYMGIYRYKPFLAPYSPFVLTWKRLKRAVWTGFARNAIPSFSHFYRRARNKNCCAHHRSTGTKQGRDSLPRTPAIQLWIQLRVWEFLVLLNIEENTNLRDFSPVGISPGVRIHKGYWVQQHIGYHLQARPNEEGD